VNALPPDAGRGPDEGDEFDLAARVTAEPLATSAQELSAAFAALAACLLDLPRTRGMAAGAPPPMRAHGLLNGRRLQARIGEAA
jgi:hypothetical protein